MKKGFVFVCLLTLVSGLFFTLPGCKRTRTQRPKRVTKNSRLLREYEAKLVDIPLSIDAQPFVVSDVDATTASEHIQFGYTSHIVSSDLIQFYVQQMERLGWLQSTTCAGHEQLLGFEKPDRYCFVSLRSSHEETTDVVIFSGQKERVV